MDDCTIRILGMADIFDEMDKLRLFEDEITTQSQEHFDQDYILGTCIKQEIVSVGKRGNNNTEEMANAT